MSRTKPAEVSEKEKPVVSGTQEPADSTLASGERTAITDVQSSSVGPGEQKTPPTHDPHVEGNLPCAL